MQPFRSSDGSFPNESRYLELMLSDFATDEISSELEPVSLSIPYAQLSVLLNRAEHIHRARESGRGEQGIKSTRRTRKRKRSSTPVDQIGSEDEAECRNQEIRAAERIDAGDEDFILSQGKRRK